MLKRCKGFSIATKSVKAKLIRSNFDLKETKTAYNEIVHFYFLLIAENPDGMNIPTKDNGGWRYYELLTLQHEFVAGFPSPLKRAAIRQAIGAYSSWNSSYQKWLGRPKRMKHHKPPIQPRVFNFNPQYDSGMYKDDDGKSIVIKILDSGSWKWVKHQYQCRDIGDESVAHRRGDPSSLTSAFRVNPGGSPVLGASWVKGAPRIQVQSNSLWIVFPLEKYVPATGGIKNIMLRSTFRTCGVDMDLDKHIVIATILETNDRGETTEVARHFINQSRHVARRKRNLGKVAIKMRKTGIVSRGFASSIWNKLSNREVEFSLYVSRQLVEFANHWKADVISFEHLGNLRPSKGKYSKRSNTKRAYWLKGKVYEQVKRTAFQDYAILTTRVSPRNTSKLDPWGNPLWRGNKFSTDLLSFNEYQNGANLVANVEGYKAHSGINASRNVALKAINRNKPSATLILKAQGGNTLGVQSN